MAKATAEQLRKKHFKLHAHHRKNCPVCRGEYGRVDDRTDAEAERERLAADEREANLIFGARQDTVDHIKTLPWWDRLLNRF